MLAQGIHVTSEPDDADREVLTPIAVGPSARPWTVSDGEWAGPYTWNP